MNATEWNSRHPVGTQIIITSVDEFAAQFIPSGKTVTTGPAVDFTDLGVDWPACAAVPAVGACGCQRTSRVTVADTTFSPQDLISIEKARVAWAKWLTEMIGARE